MRNTKKAFRWIIVILKENNIRFQIDGGFAARIYGSNRLLADIDIDMQEKNIKEILPIVRKYIVFGPARYKDKNWDLFLATLRYSGQEIDLCGSREAKIFDRNKKKWIKLPIDLSRAKRKKVFGLYVPVVSKKALLDYKKKLRRKVDLADIKMLSGEKN